LNSPFLDIFVFFTTPKSKGFASKKIPNMGEKLGIALSLDPASQFPACQVRTLEKFTITSGVCTVCHLQEGPTWMGPQVLTPNKNHDVNLFPPKNFPKHGVFVNGGYPSKWMI
jgi:hypothetical protein